ncbi:MAG: branched-chain amino acid transporter ATP-binding protein [Chloroflexi bacterium]|jgi:branched-chain amino acid transport system ATP-binding protein|nr:branched-chain amino acid transporter ATP-binding protein [Chloroflexota bacterium]
MLQVDNIEVVYNGVIKAVRNVSLEIPDKSIVTLLGANGAGKTSILRAITGVLPLQRGKLVRGSITLNGHRIDKLAPNQIIDLGIAQVLEGRRIFSSLTVEENLRAGAYSRKDSAATRKTFEHVLTLFPILQERLKGAAGYLSGGEQQMLAIGRALMAGPSLLILDEPSLGLAPLIVERIRDIIVQINKEGTAVLLVEQNAKMALSIANYGYILETGRVADARPAGELLNDEAVKRFYLGLNEHGTAHDYSHLKKRVAPVTQEVTSAISTPIQKAN